MHDHHKEHPQRGDRSPSPERRPQRPTTPDSGPSHPPLIGAPRTPSPQMSIFTPLPSAAPRSPTDALGFPEPLPGPSEPRSPEAKGKERQRTPSLTERTPTSRKRSADEVLTPPSGSAPLVFPREPTPVRRSVPPASLLPLLNCPCCPGTPLKQPTTLLCGHTVCSSHVTLPPDTPAPPVRPGQPANIPTCPVETCARVTSRVRSLEPQVGSSTQTKVTFYPTPRMDAFLNGGPQGTVIRVPNPRQDTTVTSLMGIVQRNAEEEEAERRREADGVVEGFPDEDGSSDEEPTKESSRSSSDSHSSPRTVRPRKRPRRGTLPTRNPPRAPPASGRTAGTAGADEADLTKLEKEMMGELLCSMCYLLLYEPVTTPCQHTFCAKCLQRSLDHGTACPLCREEMPGFSYHQDHANNKVVLSLILTAFPEAYIERRTQLEQEGRNSRLDTPIFYPLLAFPSTPTMLHLFEPRYRLMLRRVMEDRTYRFGAIAQSRTHSEGMEYGTMMEIRSVQMFPDGRSMLETVGTWRFRIVERGLLDGYIVAKIERIDDYPGEVEVEVEQSALPFTPGLPLARAPTPPSALVTPTSEEPAPLTLPVALSETSPLLAEVPNPTIDELMDKCRAFVHTLRSGSAPWVVQRLDTTYGDAPTDPSAYSFWIAAIMPIDEAEKAKLLPIRSTRLRLRLIVHWIEQLSNNWWFSNGCVIA